VSIPKERKKGDASPIKRKVGNLNGGMQLEKDLNVFKCANKRYRQTVASDFFISNKVITYAAIISVLLLFLGSGTAVNLGKAIGLSALFFAIHRRALYLGFYDGYEQGYTDTIEKPNNLHGTERETVLSIYLLAELEK